MEKFEILIPTIFGLEAFTSRELRNMGYETSSVEDGKDPAGERTGQGGGAADAGGLGRGRTRQHQRGRPPG